MKSHMCLVIRKNPEILWTIIGLYTIYMMYNFTSIELSAKGFFRNNNMFLYITIAFGAMVFGKIYNRIPVDHNTTALTVSSIVTIRGLCQPHLPNTPTYHRA